MFFILGSPLLVNNLTSYFFDFNCLLIICCLYNYLQQSLFLLTFLNLLKAMKAIIPIKPKPISISIRSIFF